MGSAKITLKVNLAVALKIATIVAVVSAIFFQDFVRVFTDSFTNETASYVFTIPFIFAYLVYRKRKMLGAVVPLNSDDQPRNTHYLPSICGILITAIAVLLFWYGSYTSTPLEYHMFTLPLFAAGLCLTVFNAQTLRQLAFPTLFLFFFIPLSLQIMNTLAVIIFATFIVFLARIELWKKIILLAIGIPIIYLLTIARSDIMPFIVHYFGSDLASQMLSVLSDWILLFVGTILLLTISGIAFKTSIFAKPTEKCLQCNSEPTRGQDYCRGCGRIFRSTTAKLHNSDVGKLAAVILVASLLLIVRTPAFSFTQGGVPIVVSSTPSGQQVSSQILPGTGNYTLSFLYQNIGSGTQANPDMSFVYEYTPLNQSNGPVLVSVEIAPARSFLYPWEKDAHAISQVDLRDIQLTQNPPKTGRYFVFNYAVNQTQAVLYWTETAVFMVNLTSQEKQVEISLIAYPESIDPNVLAKVELQLVTLATAVANYWQQIEMWSEITLFISQNGIILSTAAVICLCLTLIYYGAEAGKRRKASLVASRKLASPDREIVKAVQETEKPATLENVGATLQKSLAHRMPAEQLGQRLTELEKRGIIRSSVYSMDDEPLQAWKT